jgi:oligoribonuclease NrnB/cAMP/cGMP phosphodiesterase (DHH superfamily)
MKPLVIYHGNCADGFTAAWAAWKFFGRGADYHPGFYGKEPPPVDGRDVFLVDFSYKRDVLAAMAAKARRIFVLDHHKTAEADLAGFLQIKGDVSIHNAARIESGIAAHFDMARSGAMITWNFFHPEIPAPWLVQYVQDRDLWKFEMTGSREIAAYIFAHEYTFENWERLYVEIQGLDSRVDAIACGAAIEKKHHKDVAELVAAAQRRMHIAGFDVPVANLPYTMSSDAGHLMGKGEPFAACYFDTATHRVFSLRSDPDGQDVSRIAAQFGGGGHKHAAGFQIPLEDLTL